MNARRFLVDNSDWQEDNSDTAVIKLQIVEVPGSTTIEFSHRAGDVPFVYIDDMEEAVVIQEFKYIPVKPLVEVMLKDIDPDTIEFFCCGNGIPTPENDDCMMRETIAATIFTGQVMKAHKCEAVYLVCA